MGFYFTFLEAFIDDNKFRSEAGAIYTVKLFSIIRTAIINGLDPYRYIKYVLENIKDKPIDDLLPYSKEVQKMM